MNRLIAILFALILLCNYNSFGQSETSEEIYNYFHGVMTSVPYSGQLGGLALPSEGNIHALFIFVQFPDDNYTGNSSWPKGGAPWNMQNWVDQTWAQNATPYSMTDYFNQMSLNKLKFTGKVVSVTTPQTRQWYLNNSKKRYHIHKDIIEQLDQTWDFAEFDRWTKVSDYTHANNPDGKVDFIFFIWRNIAMDLPNRDSVMTQLDMGWWGSIAKTVHGPNYSVDGGQRTIILGDFGSGCTIGDYYFKDAFRFSIHEFAHYLLGGNEYHNGHAFWAMLSGYEVRSYMVNSWERYRLGWSNLITVNTSTQTISNASLPDYLTTGISYRIEINAPSNEYFFIENHQRISRWDNCSQGDPNEKGIYVMRQDRASSSNWMAADWMWLVPAEGRFNWTVSQWTPNRWGSGYLPVFKKGTTNRETGYSSTDAIPVYNPYIGQTKNYEILFIEGPNGEVILKPMRNGYGYDAFRLGYNEVFSPWSNPNSQRANRNSTGIGFKINSVINGVYTIDIYINTAINASPIQTTKLASIGK
jgi:M6 family metalloprotease-like protein